MQHSDVISNQLRFLPDFHRFRGDFGCDFAERSAISNRGLSNRCDCAFAIRASKVVSMLVAAVVAAICGASSLNMLRSDGKRSHGRPKVLA